MMHSYKIIVTWDAEDEIFVAEVPVLPGCMVHGASQQETLVEAQEAIELWVDTSREFGGPIPEVSFRSRIHPAEIHSPGI